MTSTLRRADHAPHRSASEDTAHLASYGSQGDDQDSDEGDYSVDAGGVVCLRGVPCGAVSRTFTPLDLLHALDNLDERHRPVYATLDAQGYLCAARGGGALLTARALPGPAPHALLERVGPALRLRVVRPRAPHQALRVLPAPELREGPWGAGPAAWRQVAARAAGAGLEALGTLWGRGTHRCVYCGRTHARRYGLRIHLRTHTGHRPLRCRTCARPFADPSNLNKHERLHARRALEGHK